MIKSVPPVKPRRLFVLREAEVTDARTLVEGDIIFTDAGDFEPEARAIVSKQWGDGNIDAIPIKLVMLPRHHGETKDYADTLILANLVTETLPQTNTAVILARAVRELLAERADLRRVTADPETLRKNRHVALRIKP